MNLKRRFSQIEDLPDCLDQMTISPKRLMLAMDTLPPIKALERPFFLPQMTLNPEHSQLVLYKPISLLPVLPDHQDQGDPSEIGGDVAKQKEFIKDHAQKESEFMDWE